jgi:hypothetical protein
MAQTRGRRLTKIVGYGFLVLSLIAALAITFTVGWRPVIGAKKRTLTSRKFEVTPARMQRGDYLVHAVMHCMVCHSKHDDKANPPVLAAKEGSGQVIFEQGNFRIVAPNITSDPDTGIGSGVMTRSAAPSAKASRSTEARCFLSCLTSTFATCPTKIWLRSWSSCAACQRRTAICLRRKFRLYSPASFKRRRNP